jgi:hypothetical protein
MAKSRQTGNPPSHTPNGHATELSDGTIKFKFRGAEYAVDLFTTQITIEGLLKKHKIAEGVPCSIEFLTELAQSLSDCGIAGCTVTAGYEIWTAVTNEWCKYQEHLKKNTPSAPS